MSYILPLLRKHSPGGATPDSGDRHRIAAYYLFIDPERIKRLVLEMSYQCITFAVFFYSC